MTEFSVSDSVIFKCPITGKKAKDNYRGALEIFGCLQAHIVLVGKGGTNGS